MFIQSNYINYIASITVTFQTGVPQFLSQMQKACRGYDAYLAKKAKKKEKAEKAENWSVDGTPILPQDGITNKH